MRSNRPLAAVLAVAASALLLVGCATGGGTAENSAQPDGDTITAGKLTIATGEPAYYPWVIDNKPESGKGFESAVAYAVAEKMGYAKEDVVWVRTPFDGAIAPGPKDFDLNLQQFSITNKRKAAVDFSSPYYQTSQVVITVKGSPAANAATLADLKPLLVGAATGTTSFTAIETLIAPDLGAQAFSSNDDAKLALESGTVDAIVVDLPTAFYLTGVELTGGKIIGQLPTDAATAGDSFGFVLEKDSPLTPLVTAAVDSLRTSGALDKLAATWLADAGEAPLLK